MKLLRYFHTLRYLRPVQLCGRIWVHVHRSKVDARPAPARHDPVSAFAEPARREASMLGRERFRFLNQTGEVSASDDWNDSAHPKLWLYSLHYFDDLNAEGNATRSEWHARLIRRWVRENRPGTGTGWESYPTSLRTVNWIKWMLRGNSLEQEALDSLAVQVRWLYRRLEFHLLGNHLLANAKALVFAGSFFKGDEAEEWLAKGRHLVDCEIAEQVLSDGGHFERSPMYQLIVLEDVLDLINAARAYGHEVPDPWLDAARRMLGWARVMRHPDGEIPFFNDAAIGVAPRPGQLEAYAGRLRVDSTPDPSEDTWAALDSGYVKLAAGAVTAFFDVAPVGPDYQPGHAHADTLSVEASVYDQRILVNSGTSTYEVGPERARQRGTRAHNTIAVDSQDSSEVWGGFRVARRARVHGAQVEPQARKASAWHDGYSRLRGCPRHHRSIAVSDKGLRVDDRITGGGEHAVELRWHLHPLVAVADVEDGATNGMRLIRLQTPHNHKSCVLNMIIEGPGELSIEDATYHPSFGVSQQTNCLVLRYEGALPVQTVTKLSR